MNFCPKTFRENISAYFYNLLIFPDVSAVKVETYLFLTVRFILLF